MHAKDDQEMSAVGLGNLHLNFRLALGHMFLQPFHVDRDVKEDNSLLDFYCTCANASRPVPAVIAAGIPTVNSGSQITTLGNTLG